MYRRGLSRTQIANLVGASSSKVGYHLTIARRLDPGLVLEHKSFASAATRVSGDSIFRMNELIEFVTQEGRYPSSKAASPHERVLGQWLLRRRHDFATGSLAPAFREGLQTLPGWEIDPRALTNEFRWQERLAALVNYRAQGQEWPRHKKTASEDEHTLGVWLHTQRHKLRRRELDQTKVEALDRSLPGWREGRRRGRRPRE